MLGGGNPVGSSNPSGIGQTLNYVGKHAYAYAGALPASTSAEVRLKFTTGNSYLVGRITCNGSCAANPSTSGELTGWKIEFDSQTIAILKTETVSEDMRVAVYNKIIIPPNTNVVITSQSDSDNADRLTSCMITGEVYA